MTIVKIRRLGSVHHRTATHRNESVKITLLGEPDRVRK